MLLEDACDLNRCRSTLHVLEAASTVVTARLTSAEPLDVSVNSRWVLEFAARLE